MARDLMVTPLEPDRKPGGKSLRMGLRVHHFQTFKFFLHSVSTLPLLTELWG
jgi:hypothetical protein